MRGRLHLFTRDRNHLSAPSHGDCFRGAISHSSSLTCPSFPAYIIYLSSTTYVLAWHLNGPRVWETVGQSAMVKRDQFLVNRSVLFSSPRLQTTWTMSFSFNSSMNLHLKSMCRVRPTADQLFARSTATLLSHFNRIGFCTLSSISSSVCMTLSMSWAQSTVCRKILSRWRTVPLSPVACIFPGWVLPQERTGSGTMFAVCIRQEIAITAMTPGSEQTPTQTIKSYAQAHAILGHMGEDATR